MDVEILSRIQFAVTVAFHYIYPPMSIGLGVLLVIMEGMYLKTGKKIYENMTRFWVKIFALIFAMGVATGIVMEFEFGTNWATYSRYVGDIFGSALAAEGIFAFFLESGFLAILVFGSGRFLAEKENYVTFFDGSVKGLRVGAPVTFRGVNIGVVNDVRLMVDSETLEVSIPVYFETNPGAFHVIQGEGGEKRGPIRSKERTELVHKMLIEQGMRAQLQAQSLVTGQLQVEIDFHPDTEVVLRGLDPEALEVPAIKSGMQQLAEKIDEIPLSEIAHKAADALTGIEEIVNSEDVRQALKALVASSYHLENILNSINNELPGISAELKVSLGNFNTLMATLNEQVEPLGEDARKVMANANVAMANISDSTRRGSDFRVELRQMMRDLRLAANSLRLLAEQLERQPESILKGKSGGQK